MLGKSDLGAPSSSRPSAPLTAQLGKLSCGSQRWTAPSIFAAAGKDARSGAWNSASSFFNRRAEERLPLLADLEAGSFGYYGSFRARLVGAPGGCGLHGRHEGRALSAQSAAGVSAGGLRSAPARSHSKWRPADVSCSQVPAVPTAKGMGRAAGACHRSRTGSGSSDARFASRPASCCSPPRSCPSPRCCTATPLRLPSNTRVSVRNVPGPLARSWPKGRRASAMVCGANAL